ncbi:MAG: hypothetical protein P9M14_03905 [Candidatus Alcyoniella australis]|nr:hypothetical protein [Candidatus Alcyoniella australis]
MKPHTVKALLLMALLASLVFLALSVSGCQGDDDDDIDDDAADDDVDDDDVDDDDDNIDDDDDDDDDEQNDGCIQGEFDPYWGVMHCHTGYSDGEQTPADAFAYARDTAQLDILLVTDHLEQLYFPLPVNRYPKCMEQADEAYDPDVFLSDCGFEYGSGFRLPLFQSTGHNNVFNSAELFPMIQLDFHDFYDDLVACEECVGQFNHPGSDPYQTWEDFDYFPEVDQNMNLFEFNGGGDVWELYFLALDNGWHVSPTYNQDNHGADWGTKNDRRSGLYLDGLTRGALYEAMDQRRSFMSYDLNASLRMMAQDTCWMGSILKGHSELLLDLEAIDDDETDGFDRIEIYGPQLELLETIDCLDETFCTAQLDFAVSEATFFVAKAIQTDGDWLVAAPIWVEP